MKMLYAGMKVVYNLQVWTIKGFMSNGNIFIVKDEEFAYVGRSSIYTNKYIVKTISIKEKIAKR